MSACNLIIVKNKKLRKLFTKCPKYQQNKTRYGEKSRANTISVLEDCIDDIWYLESGQHKINLLEWKLKSLKC